MPSKKFLRSVVLGLASTSLLLTSSSRSAAISQSNPSSDPLISAANRAGKSLYASSRFSEAHHQFQKAAERGELLGDTHAASVNWGNAGGCSMVELNFRASIKEFRRARQIAEQGNDSQSLASARNNLASLYIHMGQPANALQTAREALAGLTPALVLQDPGLHPKFTYQLAVALVQLNRYPEAVAAYREAIAELIDQGDWETAGRVLSSFGAESLKAGRIEDAESALSHALWLVRIHHAKVEASVLEGLAQLRARQGDVRSARILFDAALAAAPGVSPRWRLFAGRGRFRLSLGELQGALEDFRQARELSSRMRLDIVPADQDRVAIESGLSELNQWFVEAGNRWGIETNHPALFKETFDAAEQDRLWSLRALIPGADDWRSRLPESYWDSLARYQSLQRASIAHVGATDEGAGRKLAEDLRRMESEAAGEPMASRSESPLNHIATVLKEDAVLLSFHISKTSSWLWAVDRRRGVQAFRLPGYQVIEQEAADFVRQIKDDNEGTAKAGSRLYTTLFGTLPPGYRAHKHWLLEPDGPLYAVPFAALVTNGSDSSPRYLMEETTSQFIPGALLLDQRPSAVDGDLVAIGDPVYNAADPRYRASGKTPEMTLPRLPNTGPEVHACARAWGFGRSRSHLGTSARISEVDRALRSGAAILHFATHVVPTSSEHRTGMIALSLDPSGAMGLLGPREIVAHRTQTTLVVMDGCHSSQADALPGAGLMGLTRAWIGAGARSVIATHWDMPDQDSGSLMPAFYRALASPDRVGIAEALRAAQISSLREGRKASTWASYFLESRSH